MASLGAFYKAGLDYFGRQIVVFVGRHFPAPKVDMSKVCVMERSRRERRRRGGGRGESDKEEGYRVCIHLSPCIQAMAYFVHVMETVVHKDYVLVYFHTMAESDNQPDSNFFKQLYSMVDDR